MLGFDNSFLGRCGVLTNSFLVVGWGVGWWQAFPRGVWGLDNSFLGGVGGQVFPRGV